MKTNKCMKTKFVSFTTAGLLAFGLSVGTANAWCWLTGGGTVDNPNNSTGVPDFSFGGVVSPGCDTNTSDGGNWNIVDHRDGLHFKALMIVNDGCSGVPDKAPPVDVNHIDFEGIGTVTGIDGNPLPETAVVFYAEAVDNGEPGGGKDLLYFTVYDDSTTYFTISAPEGGLMPISTGNLQIHTTPCSKFE